MRYVTAFLAAVVGVAAGIYVGGYIMLYGGIIHVINGITASPVNAGGIAWGIIQVFVLAELLGGLIFVIGFGIAAAIAGSESRYYSITHRRRKRLNRRSSYDHRY